MQDNDKSWQEQGEIGAFRTLAGEGEVVHPFGKQERLTVSLSKSTLTYTTKRNETVILGKK